MKLLSNRAGKLFTHQTQYQYFLPTSLLDVDIKQDNEMFLLLVKANLCLTKLDTLSSSLPNKDVFISMYVFKEAVISSQIEGTQISLDDVLQANVTSKRKDINEIVNYTNALNEGIKLLNELPICSRYFKHLHKLLVKDVRGQDKSPGEFRHTQNWIGPKDCGLTNATYIPPEPDGMNDCLKDLEKFINKEKHEFPLIDIALIHYQFETIHPFLDGNGRVGRLLIPLWLINNNLLNDPLIYPSLYFKENRSQYYSLLMDVRTKGNYEEWIKFFLKGLISTSLDSIETINKIINLKNDIMNSIINFKPKNNKNLINSISYIFKSPYFTSSELKDALSITKPTVSTIIKTLLDLDIIVKKDNKQRNSTYCFTKYVNILKPGSEL